jgi:2-dehydro-3-deoxygluconokinase
MRSLKTNRVPPELIRILDLWYLTLEGGGMAVIATFGEIMLRLSPPGRELLFQSPRLEAVFGGGEANVAISLALLGHQVRFVSAVPKNDIGDAAVRELRRWDVDTRFVLRQGRRLGVYFAEAGANQRASKVIYDREGSGLAEAIAGDFGWPKILEGVRWFHVTGITPALSATAAELTLESVKAARARKVKVSVDLNYRSKLWKFGKTAPEVMREVVKYADLLLGNEEDCPRALGIGTAAGVAAGDIARGDYERLTGQVMNDFPNLARVAITLRESHGADHNGWSAVLRNRTGFISGPSYDIRNIVDRIGSGDALAAGLIHGLMALPTDEEALAFAVAASCLKHSIPGDFNLATETDIRALMAGDASGRVRR